MSGFSGTPLRAARWLVLAASAALLWSGCASGSAPAAARGSRATASAQPARAATSTRTLRVAFQGFEEPKGGVISYGSVGGFDPLEHFMVFHASLTVYNPQGQLIPRLAEKVPSLQDGDWKTLPDGSMDVTWKIRKDARWHDGQPLTSDDFAFGFDVLRDPDVPTSRPSWLSLVSGLDPVDANTFVVHWKETSFLAGGTGAGDIAALPRHILGQLYQAGDRQTFINAPYWTTEFVGLGPYRLGEWQRGSYIEGLAFDGYVLGKPKIDRILLTYVGDVNAIVGGILSGDLDMVPMGTRFDATQLVAVQNGWGPDGGTAILVPFGVRTIWLQFRDAAAPWARDVRVRRALVHATDRQGMSDALQWGLTKPADTFLLPEDAGFPAIERAGLQRYPFDADRARQLLVDAGWTPGPDRVLRDAAGQPLTMDVSATGQGSNVEEIETVSNQWQAVGIQATPAPLPPSSANLDELKSSVHGGFLWPWSPSPTSPQNLTSTQIPSERTVWKGPNYGGYSNQTYDDLYGRYTTTLDTSARQDVLGQMLALVSEEVPVVPIYYYGNGVIARKGLTGPAMIPSVQTSSLWNVHEWAWTS